jgi:hypothetical protein
MNAAMELEEYLDELREHVCRRCIARRAGGPPCGLLGVGCGVEQHLPELVEICETVHSELIDPYIERLEAKICATCNLRHGPCCPCPLSYLLPLAVEAIEQVNRGHAQPVGSP